MSNLPEGVTGNEWQIAGADEDEIDGECGDCGFEGEVEAYCTDFEDWYWTCPACGEDKITVIGVDLENPDNL